MQYSSKKDFFGLLVAFWIVPLSGVSVDVYVSSLPQVVHHFSTTQSLAQLTITTYMIGMGIGQLIAGSISDAWGRKQPALFGMLIYLASVLVIPMAHSIFLVLVCRLLQGLAMSFCSVSMRAVIPDLCKERELKRMMTYLTMAWSLGPIIAPVIGGYLQHYFNWKAPFYFLFFYGLIGFTGLFFYFHETCQYRHALKLSDSLKTYRDMLLSLKFLLPTLINSILYSMVVLFSMVGCFLIQVVLGYSSVVFGYVALGTGFFWFLGIMTNRIILDVSDQRKHMFCLFGISAMTLIMIIEARFFSMNLPGLMIPIFGICWMGGVLFPHNGAKIMKLFPTATGSANALFGTLLYLISSMLSGLGSLLTSDTSMSIALIYFVCALVMLALHFRKPLS